MTYRRQAVRCAAKNDGVNTDGHRKPIFHLHHGMPCEISMADAEMAIETCMNVPSKDRSECYVAFGVDGDAIEEYFYIVNGLEKTYHNSSFYSNRTDPSWMCRVKEQLRNLYNARVPRTARKPFVRPEPRSRPPSPEAEVEND